MTFISDDFDRFLSNEIRLLFPELRSYHTSERMVQQTIDSVRLHLRDGVRERQTMQSLVAGDVEEKHAGVIPAGLLMATVSYVCRRILEKVHA